MNRGGETLTKQIKISIITAAYNVEKTIEQTILSIVQQDYPNLEYIIVDGNSTDKTVEIIKKYASHYGIKWVSEPDKGLYDALNKGVHMATGDYIEIIGADDSLTSTTIVSEIVAQIDADVDIFGGELWCVDEKTKRQISFTNDKVRDRDHYSGSAMIPHAAMFVRRELLLRYPFDTGYQMAADYKFFLQCYYDKTVRIKFGQEKVAFFSSSGMSSDPEACWIEDNRIYQELGLPFHSPNYKQTSLMKYIVWKALVFLGLFKSFQIAWRYISIRTRWTPHTCANKICRWCERYE